VHNNGGRRIDSRTERHIRGTVTSGAALMSLSASCETLALPDDLPHPGLIACRAPVTPGVACATKLASRCGGPLARKGRGDQRDERARCGHGRRLA
jgi:hypothetical protein